MGTAKKPQKNITEQLYNHIYNDILKGASISNLLYTITHDGYELGKTYKKSIAYELINDVREKIKNDYREEQKDLREKNLSRLYDLYADAYDAVDRRGCLDVLKEINKMCGVYPDEKLKADVTLSGDITIDFNLANNDESNN